MQFFLLSFNGKGLIHGRNLKYIQCNDKNDYKYFEFDARNGQFVGNFEITMYERSLQFTERTGCFGMPVDFENVFDYNFLTGLKGG